MRAVLAPALHPHRAGTAGRGFRRAWGTPASVLNVGSGNDVQPGWVNMDLYAEAEVRHDILQTPWPFEDGSFEGVWCSHVLEHIPPGCPDGLGAVLREIERVLAPGGRCCILVPYPGTACDLANLTHFRRFHPESFHWLDPASKGCLRFMYGVEHLRLRYRGVQRAFTVLGAHSGYHTQKHLGRAWNIGPKAGLVFVLERI